MFNAYLPKMCRCLLKFQKLFHVIQIRHNIYIFCGTVTGTGKYQSLTFYMYMHLLVFTHIKNYQFQYFN